MATLHNIQRLRVVQEATFATEVSNPSSFTDVPFIEGTLEAGLTQEMLNPQTAQQDIDGYPDQEKGRRSCTLSFQIPLMSTALTASDGVTQVENALGTVLKTVFGQQTLATGDLVSGSTSPTTTAFDITNGGTPSGRDLDVGRVVGLETGDNGEFEMRTVKSDTAATVVLGLALSNAPSEDDTIYGCATYNLTADPDKTLQFVVEGEDADNRYLFTGLQLESLSFDFPLNEIPKVTFSLKGVDWKYASETTMELTGTIESATYSNLGYTRVDGDFYVGNKDTDTLAAASASNISTFGLNSNLSFVPVPSPNGTNGVARWKRGRNAPVFTAEVQLPYEDEQFYKDRDNKQAKFIYYQFGDTPGSSVLVHLPNLQITDVQPGAADQIAAQTVTFAARPDDLTGGAAPDGNEKKTAIRIAQG